VEQELPTLSEHLSSLSTEDKTWQDAKLDCELTGGYLIILDSPEKLSTVNNILKTYGMSIKQIL
jgi:hypothetical protein